MTQGLGEAEAYSAKWLDIIQKPEVTEAEGKEIISESLSTSPSTSTAAGSNTASPSPRRATGR